MRVAGLILAAGAGTRMGRPKADVVFGGRRLVDRQVDLLRQAGCDPVVVVLGAARLTVPDAVTVTNPHWTRGMGSSLAAGLAHLGDPVTLDSRGGATVEAVAVVLVDQPGLIPAAITATIAALSGDLRAARASYQGRPGHPVVLARSTWGEVAAAASADEGARGWLAKHNHEVVLVACDGLGDDDDVDTFDQLLTRESKDENT